MKTNHGGVAAIITDTVTQKIIPPPFKSEKFESLCFSISSCSTTVVVLLLYRPGSETVTYEFFVELTKYLESLALMKCQIVVAGDFNIHTERPNDNASVKLQDILSSFDCLQHMPATPTHRDGGTLDLVITKSEQIVDNL